MSPRTSLRPQPAPAAAGLPIRAIVCERPLLAADLLGIVLKAQLGAEVAFARDGEAICAGLKSGLRANLVVIGADGPGRMLADQLAAIRSHDAHTALLALTNDIDARLETAVRQANAAVLLRQATTAMLLLGTIRGLLPARGRSVASVPASSDHERAVERLRDLGLSRQQAEVARLVADGHSNRQIAQALGLSLNTVKTHMRFALRKLKARNRTEAALLVARLVEKRD